MLGIFLLAIGICVGQSAQSADTGVLSGVVRDGTHGKVRLPNAEVVLRAGEGFNLVPIASTTTDENGNFSFQDLPINAGITYVAGVNHQGVHFPGPSVKFDQLPTANEVQLVAYDAVESPSPLTARRHDLVVGADSGFLEISETLVIENRTATAFVGKSAGDEPPVTLRISLPAGFETVTFATERQGRQFRVAEGAIVTDMPWPPGAREFQFKYRLPVERRSALFSRKLDCPTDHLTVHVNAGPWGPASCNIPAMSGARDKQGVFEHQGPPLPAGYVLELQLGSLPVRWDAYGRWLAVSVLALLIAGALYSIRSSGRNAVTTIPLPGNDRDRKHRREKGRAFAGTSGVRPVNRARRSRR